MTDWARHPDPLGEQWAPTFTRRYDSGALSYVQYIGGHSLAITDAGPVLDASRTWLWSIWPERTPTSRRINGLAESAQAAKDAADHAATRLILQGADRRIDCYDYPETD